MASRGPMSTGNDPKSRGSDLSPICEHMDKVAFQVIVLVSLPSITYVIPSRVSWAVRSNMVGEPI